MKAEKDRIFPARKWTQAAIECRDSFQDCSNCMAHRFHGFHPMATGSRKCHMPDAIARLQAEGVGEPIGRHSLKPPRLGALGRGQSI